MKLINILLTIDLACLWPMLLFLLGAFILGWLLKSLFGKKDSQSSSLLAQAEEDWKLKISGTEKKLGLLTEEHENLKALHAAAPKTVEVTSPAILKEVDELKAALQAEKSKAPHVEEKIVEKIVEVAPPALLKEVDELKAALQIEKNKAPRIEEKIVEKRVEVASPLLIKEISDLKIALEAEKNKASHIEDKNVEKTVEVAPPALLKEVDELKAALQAEKNKAPRIEEKIVEKTVEVASPALLKEVDELKATLSQTQQESAAVTLATQYKIASDVMGTKVVEDDLKLVEGIGPKIEELFHAAGLKTWKSVADSSPEKLKEILIAAGDRFQMHDPGTWPRQCQLMVDGKWGTLYKYQGELIGGVEQDKAVGSSSKLQAPAPPKNYENASKLYGKKIVENDLKLVEGIGPKIEELFHAAGLKTWKSVADSLPEQLKEILVGGGERFQMHDPATWPRQCQLMVDDEWESLKNYQDALSGGKE